MRGIQGRRGIFTRIPGNVIDLTFGECSWRSPGKLLKIPGNVSINISRDVLLRRVVIAKII